ncbi:MAG: hypothetical protein PHE96_12680, partial [Methylococcales bacterium]|nr:hypothetical protein [Methylococcales bacterium]
MSIIVALADYKYAKSVNNAVDWSTDIYPGQVTPGLCWNGSVFCAVTTPYEIYDEINNQYINVSGRDTYTSTDGVTWVKHADVLPQVDSWLAIAWNGAIFCALAGSQDSAVVATSPDGIVWTARTGIAAGVWH